MVDSVHAPPPLMVYRLDLGEPGVRIRAPATQSAYLVTSQEIRNQTRLRNAAVGRGETIVSSDTVYRGGIDGGTMTLRGGLTTVASSDKPSLVDELGNDLAAAMEPADSDPGAATAEVAVPPPAMADAETLRILALRRNEVELLAAAGRIQTQLLLAREAELRARGTANQVEAQQARRELEQASAALRSQLDRVRLEQIVDSLTTLATQPAQSVRANAALNQVLTTINAQYAAVGT